MFTGTSPAEPLAGSSLDAGAEAQSPGNVLFPFSPHTTTSRREGTTFTAATYITQVTPTTGSAYSAYR